MRKTMRFRDCFYRAVIMVLLLNLMAVLIIRYSGWLAGILTNEKALSDILMQLTQASILPSVCCFAVCTLVCGGLTGLARQKPGLRRLVFALTAFLSAISTFLMIRVNSLPMHAAIRAIMALAEGGVL